MVKPGVTIDYVPQWIEVENTASTDAPPYGVARVTGINSAGQLTIDRPNADNLTAVVFIGPGGIPKGGKGLATTRLPAKALCNSTPAIASGAEWGVKNAEWKLFQTQTGFEALIGVDAEIGVFHRKGGSSLAAGSGADVVVSVITDCDEVAGLSYDNKTLSGYVTINGTNFPVFLTLTP
jgi:hypothetical protein